MLSEEGITLAEISRKKLWPVITGIEIRYLKPAFMDEELEIRTQAIEFSKIRFCFEQNIFKEGVQCVTAKVSSVVINAEGRPIPVPNEYNRLWLGPENREKPE